jgi:UDP-N-acetylmuramate dehydrogenase
VTVTDRQMLKIEEIVQGRVLRQAPLSQFTSFKIGGPADVVAEPAGLQELKELITYLKEEKIPRIVLGAGTNVLFHDRGFRGAVVRTNQIKRMDFLSDGLKQVRITVSAGILLPQLVKRTCDLGWTGLENLWGIPGSFGGAVATNAGAGGVSIADHLVTIKFLTENAGESTLEKKDFQYGYRFMRIPPKSVVVLGILELMRGDEETIAAAISAARERRQQSQPSGKPSAGCVFKNPAPDKPAGAIIDRLGFKGKTVGDAQVSEVHANYIVNVGAARASDVLELMEMIRTRVREAEGLELEPEIHVVGEGTEDE